MSRVYNLSSSTMVMLLRNEKGTEQLVGISAPKDAEAP